MRRTLEPQDQISRYSVVGPLGAGGMGEVYIAKDETLDRNVALKVLPSNLVRNEERVRRFIIEAKSASSLNHPNIVTIYEIGQDRVRVSGGTDPDPQSAPVHFISMELVQGETLGHKIHEENVDLRTLLGWLAQAAEGIAKAHAAGIVHRDLKPGNVMVSKDGFAKVLDFGLAKLTERQSESGQGATSAPTEMPATSEGVIMGTAGYMSPEQVQGKAVDQRSDIFALGCVIYEAATRRRPFVADSDVEVMHKILRERPTPVEDINPQVPADVRRIIRRCLAKSPDQRYQSMKDVAIELREAYDEYDSLPVSGQSAPSVPSGDLGAPQRTRRKPVAAIVAVGVLVVFGLLAGGYFLRGQAPAGNTAGAGVPDMKMSVLMSRDDIEQIVISSDGRYLAYVTSAEEKSSLNVRQVRTGGDVRILPPQEYPIRGLSFSPDGDYIYYLNQDPVSPSYSALFQVASLGGTPKKVFFDVDSAAAFSPDGSRVCFRRGKPDIQADTLVVGDLQTGKERELIRVAMPQNFASVPSWSPDGKRVAVVLLTTQGGFRSRIGVIDAESGHLETIGSTPFTFADSPAWLPDGTSLIVSAARGAEIASQIYRVSYPGGDTRRLTNDLNGYSALSLASASRSIAAMRKADVANVWVVPVDGGKEAHPVTSATGPSGSSREPVPLPGGDVVISVNEGDKVHLFRAAADGSERRQLVGTGAVNFGPAYGEKAGIAFSQMTEDFAPHVWRVDPDGSGLRQLTEGKGEMLDDLSRDGRIALIRKMDDAVSVWSVDPVAGGEPKRLATSTSGDAGTISPDGRLIRYPEFTTVQGRIYAQSVVIPSGGGEPVAKLVLPPGASAPRWSPDSKALTYFDRAKGWNLMRQPITGGEPVELTHFTEGVTTSFAWSPDGAHIAVARRVGPKTGLWLIQPGKGEPKLLAEFRSGAITDPRFALDGKSVVFVYGTSSKDVVLISDFQ